MKRQKGRERRRAHDNRTKEGRITDGFGTAREKLAENGVLFLGLTSDGCYCEAKTVLEGMKPEEEKID